MDLSSVWQPQTSHLGLWWWRANPNCINGRWTRPDFPLLIALLLVRGLLLRAKHLFVATMVAGCAQHSPPRRWEPLTPGRPTLPYGFPAALAGKRVAVSGHSALVVYRVRSGAAQTFQFALPNLCFQSLTTRARVKLQTELRAWLLRDGETLQ